MGVYRRNASLVASPVYVSDAAVNKKKDVVAGALQPKSGYLIVCRTTRMPSITFWWD